MHSDAIAAPLLIYNAIFPPMHSLMLSHASAIHCMHASGGYIPLKRNKTIGWMLQHAIPSLSSPRGYHSDVNDDDDAYGTDSAENARAKVVVQVWRLHSGGGDEDVCRV